MRSLECRVTRQQIDELELGERPSERATAHLSLCAGCRDFRAERNELRQLVGSLEPVVAPADFEMRLRARIAREQPPSREPFFARLIRTPALAAAALFVMVGGTLVWVAQKDIEPSTQVATVQQPSPVAKASDSATTTSAPSDAPEASTAGDEAVHTVSSGTPRKSRVGSRGHSQDYSVLPADSVRQGDQVYVNAPSKPVVFALEDERGTKRKISLPPVSFGSQSLVDNRVPVSYAGNSRVW
ncbi:MAG TPA: hypothetical protein VJV21_00815 [Pyrinomonadaceae bacterium]|nr:hypothetical protein [Pyrinomonadaceae bacterium]